MKPVTHLGTCCLIQLAVVNSAQQHWKTWLGALFREGGVVKGPKWTGWYS